MSIEPIHTGYRTEWTKVEALGKKYAGIWSCVSDIMGDSNVCPVNHLIWPWTGKNPYSWIRIASSETNQELTIIFKFTYENIQIHQQRIHEWNEKWYWYDN